MKWMAATIEPSLLWCDEMQTLPLLTKERAGVRSQDASRGTAAPTDLPAHLLVQLVQFLTQVGIG